MSDCLTCTVQTHTANMVKVCHARATKDERRASEHGPEVLADLHDADHDWAKVAR